MIKFDFKTGSISEYQIKKIAKAYLNGDKVLIYPTDTIYGIGGNPLKNKVIERIFSIKRRPRNKGLPILSHSLKKVEEICHLNDLALDFANKFWPGPLTIVLRKKPIIPSLLTGSQDTVAVRIPNHEFCLKLMEAGNGYLIGTSANLSSDPNPAQIEEISPEVLEQVDMIVDMGKCKNAIPSTIVDLSSSNLKILRKGSLDLSEWKHFQ